MCHISRNSGIWLFSWLAASLLGVASSICSAQAQYFWQGQAGPGGAYVDDFDATEAGSEGAQMIAAGAVDPNCNSNGGANTCYTGSVSSLQCGPITGQPTAAGENTSCSFNLDATNGHGLGGISFTSYACSQFPSQCASIQTCQNGAGVASYSSGLSATEGVTHSSAGCFVQISPPGSGVCMSVPSMGAGWTCSVRTGGAFINASGSSASSQSPSNCVSSGGLTSCVQSTGSGAGQCATFNGDQACPSALQPGQGCVYFQSGGMECATSGGPGGTVTGGPTTSGSPDTPSAQVTAGSPTNYTNTVNYYSSTLVAGSSTSFSSGNSGSNVGNGGSGSGSGGSGGTGTGTGCGSSGSPCAVADANGAANGDCGASGVSCSSGNNPLPSYDWSSDSWSGATTSFYNAVASGPLGSAVGGISSNWPGDGSCPGATVSLSTINYTANFGEPLCNTWESSAAPVLGAVMLAVWSIAAVYIFLSA